MISRMMDTLATRSGRRLALFLAIGALAGCGSGGAAKSEEPTPTPTTSSEPGQASGLENGDFKHGRVGWTPHVTLGKVTAFEPVRAAGGKPAAARVSATHTGGDEAGVLELVSKPIQVEPGRAYTLKSTVRVRGDIGRRGARNRIFWLRDDQTALDPKAGGEKKLHSGGSASLEDRVVPPPGAAFARVAPGAVVAGVPRATIEISAVSFGPAK